MCASPRGARADGAHAPPVSVRALYQLNEVHNSLLMACAADGAVRWAGRALACARAACSSHQPWWQAPQQLLRSDMPCAPCLAVLVLQGLAQQHAARPAAHCDSLAGSAGAIDWRSSAARRLCVVPRVRCAAGGGGAVLRCVAAPLPSSRQRCVHPACTRTASSHSRSLMETLCPWHRPRIHVGPGARALRRSAQPAACCRGSGVAAADRAPRRAAHLAAAVRRRRRGHRCVPCAAAAVRRARPARLC